MSEESLQRFLDRIREDDAFRVQLKSDPEAALQSFELSGTERYALVANDEDALRRLLGVETVGFESDRRGALAQPSAFAVCPRIDVYDAGSLAPGFGGGDAASTKIDSCGWTFGTACC